VYQNLTLVEQNHPDLVAIFGADHIYRMDVREMVRFHQEQEAEVSVAALPVPLKEASAFGIIATEPDGRIREFQEKPEQPSPMPADPTRAFASMGNYLFNTKVLVEALKEARERGEHDFGKHVLPRLMHTHRLFAYDFTTSTVPGVKSYEEQGYWRDVGSIDAYFAAHQDVLGLEPRFDAFNPQWPIYSSYYPGPVAKIISGQIENSIFAAGTVVNGAKVRNSVIRREVVLEPDVELEDCIIMDFVRIKRGARLRQVIVDRFNTIEAHSQIGFDPDADRRLYHVTPSGVVVMPMGQVGKYARSAASGYERGYEE
jgi:glucose-1-phosphate adenylyltransferase